MESAAEPEQLLLRAQHFESLVRPEEDSEAALPMSFSCREFLPMPVDLLLVPLDLVAWESGCLVHE